MSKQLGATAPSYSRVPARATSEPVHRDEQLIVWLLTLFFFLRVAVPNWVLNEVEHYSTLGGSILEKIHPGAIGLLVLSIVVIYSQTIPIKQEDRRIVGASWTLIFAIIGLALVGYLEGRSDGFSYLIDSLIVGPLVCLAMLRISDRARVQLMKMFIYFMVLNTCVVFGEYATHQRIYPYGIQEAFFRPTAFLGHPLTVGLITVSTMPFVWLMQWSTFKKLSLTLFFLFGTYASQARMASLFGTVCALGCIWVHLARSTRQGKIDEGAMLTIASAALGGVLVILLIFVSSGLAARLLHYGIFQDESSLSRLKIYSIFQYMTTDQILYGLHRSWYEYLLQNELNLETSESPFVNFIVQFGAIGGGILMASILYLMWALATHGRNIYVAYGVMTFLVVAMTSNEFTSKSPEFTIITALVTAARAAGRQSAWMPPPQRIARRWKPPPSLSRPR